MIKIKRVIKNNLYIIAYIIKSCPLYIPLNLLNSAITSSVAVLNLVFIKIIIDKISSGGNFRNLLFIILIYGLTLMTEMITSTWFRNCYNPQSILKIQTYMQNMMFEKIKTIDLKCYDDSEFYDKYVKAMYEADGRVQSVADTLIGMFGNLITITSIASIMAVIDPIFIVFALINVLSSVSISFFVNKQQYNFTQSRIEFDRKRDYIKRTFYLQQFAKELRIFYFSSILKKIFSDSTQSISNLLKIFSHKVSKLNMVNSFIRIIINIIMMVYLCWQVINGKLTTGDFLALFNAVTSLSGSLTQFINVIPQLCQHSLYINNLREFMEYKSEIEGIEQGYIIKSNTISGININDVSFSYPNQEEFALKNINIKIKSGEKIALVGHNGSGKSTLIKLVLRLYDPTTGNIELDDYDYKELNIKSLRNNFGVFLQDFQNYSFSIGENVLMRNISEGKDVNIVWKALKLSGLYNKVKSMINGIYSELTKEFSNDGILLSGGELQKLALARVFAKECGVVILDEPSSFLDPISEREMFDNMINTAKNKTIIIVSHRLSSIKKVDVIYYMEKGEIIEQGSHDYLMSINGKYARMFNIQAEMYK